MTGRDVTPNLRTHLDTPDAQLIHLHGLICAAHALPLLRIIAKPSLAASVEEGKQEGTDQKPRSQFAPAMEWSPGRCRESRVESRCTSNLSPPRAELCAPYAHPFTCVRSCCEYSAIPRAARHRGTRPPTGPSTTRSGENALRGADRDAQVRRQTRHSHKR